MEQRHTSVVINPITQSNSHTLTRQAADSKEAETTVTKRTTDYTMTTKRDASIEQ